MLFCVYLLIRKRAVLRYIFASWRLMLACWLTFTYYNIFSNKSQKETAKKALFFAYLLPSEMKAADSQMTTSFFTLQSWMLDAGYWILEN